MRVNFSKDAIELGGPLDVVVPEDERYPFIKTTSTLIITIDPCHTTDQAISEASELRGAADKLMLVLIERKEAEQAR